MFLKGILDNEIESGFSNNQLSDKDVQSLKQFMEIDSFESLDSCTWIYIKGTKYYYKMVLTSNVNIHCFIC